MIDYLCQLETSQEENIFLINLPPSHGSISRSIGDCGIRRTGHALVSGVEVVVPLKELIDVTRNRTSWPASARRWSRTAAGARQLGGSSAMPRPMWWRRSRPSCASWRAGWRRTRSRRKAGEAAMIVKLLAFGYACILTKFKSRGGKHGSKFINSGTFSSSGGEQNIAQGRGAIGKQVKITL